jgi:hypothetical protein
MQLVIRRDAFDALFDGQAGEIPNGVRMEHDAKRALAQDAFFIARRAAAHGRESEQREFVAFARALWSTPPAWASRELQQLEVSPRTWRHRSAADVERVRRGIRGRRSWRRWHQWGMW